MASQEMESSCSASAVLRMEFAEVISRLAYKKLDPMTVQPLDFDFG